MRITPYDPSFDVQMRAAREGMGKSRCAVWPNERPCLAAALGY